MQSVPVRRSAWPTSHDVIMTFGSLTVYSGLQRQASGVALCRNDSVGGSTVAPTLSRLTHLPYHRYQSAGLATAASHAYLYVTFWGLDLTSPVRLGDCICILCQWWANPKWNQTNQTTVKFKLKAPNFLLKANFIFFSNGNSTSFEVRS